MSCTSCGIPEMYQNYSSPEQAPSGKAACPAKSMQQSCTYTTQGELICQKEEQIDRKNAPANEEMARNIDFGFAKTAAPWTNM